MTEIIITGSVVLFLSGIVFKQLSDRLNGHEKRFESGDKTMVNMKEDITVIRTDMGEVKTDIRWIKETMEKNGNNK